MRAKILVVCAALAVATSGGLARAEALDGFEATVDARNVSRDLGMAEEEAAGRQTCVGLANGTAHRSCGTLTGGPSGGLF